MLGYFGASSFSGSPHQMADTDTPRQATPPPASDTRAARSGGGDQSLTEEAVRRLIHEEVAAAVATALARPPSGPGEQYSKQAHGGGARAAVSPLHRRKVV